MKQVFLAQNIAEQRVRADGAATFHIHLQESSLTWHLLFNEMGLYGVEVEITCFLEELS
ncbi:hypothetical protein WJ0W_003912 [Paenibacillus melissococcoides]|uniref:Uncharacterized protein n=1 Tax=Paenibacillus melissococcoides TaxID=2912268 RepID=A0ABM9G5N8_9BACL|nr:MULTISPECIES: hypothetical protein [Paenibacillus]MEB9892305.1 hypothetical protein [Bacillus cereus]CAH8246678.1 hypothetical protein WJ0W_003912 [Paenibacillus melissococcoides]CAH8715423.1 hypothetical protein HTL2_004281 [Paenibacillus melissococcoides]CAH8716386.1 hypothetical protein WDD9_004548 [Paenibacillus melissococcoides]GIO80271.1 hypothetical protein J6TS7_38810 [Paenibacillus dendritiformis]